MIQALSNIYRRLIAGCFSLIFYLQMIYPLYGYSGYEGRLIMASSDPSLKKSKTLLSSSNSSNANLKSGASVKNFEYRNKKQSFKSNNDIGGPGSPEANSFKAASTDNLVNLFTGDFSYSIPLLDVDGYPVNLFYNAGITMDQEATWVGLGWNINPGTVTRNMRGVPDDFNGKDTLEQTQNVKPNKTWGGEIGADAEVIGIKKPNLNFNVGFSYNNYLGPELELGAGISVSIPILKTVLHEKSAPQSESQGLNLSLDANAKLSSRSGLTLSPSLNAGVHDASQKIDLGIGLSTSYNSRTGIKNLTINSQVSMYHYRDVDKGEITYHPRAGASTRIVSSSISFARPSYIPTLRMPMQYSNYSGQIELGTGMFGLRGAATAQGYYSVSKIADGATTIKKPLIGYIYEEKADGWKDAVMDFNRLNDGEVTPHTPVLSAPQYDYDIFSIQGEGTGGSIRAYRNDLGFMRDIETASKDQNISIGFDIAPAGHYGGNWNVVSTPTKSGNWSDANNTLNETLKFTEKNTNSAFKNVYFRNPGEATVTNDVMINKIGGDKLVRFQLGGSTVSPRLESKLEQFDKKTGVQVASISLSNSTLQNDKRTQVITMLTAAEASQVGVDTWLKSYQTTLDANNNLKYDSMSRISAMRKPHHISEISVLESTGMRYIYGLPVYNIYQKDFTFSVANIGDPITNLVRFSATNEPQITSSHITSNTGIDGYLNIQKTPGYASAFLLTGLLSPDYVDVTGNGITEDDLGNFVKFNYTMSSVTHRWRTPRKNLAIDANTAYFNQGIKTEKRDNKATISYGERESWYLHSIESKSMIAVFKTSSRFDAKGVTSELDGRINAAENSNLKLDSIMVYTKADIKANGLSNAVPLKTIHFDYDYSLCSGTPDNATNGKLTLLDIYFTYNGQVKAAKNKYVFDYGQTGPDSYNPSYAYSSSDKWGYL